MATEEILPGSALNQAPSEQPADPQHTDSTASSATTKPFNKHNSSSPSPSPATPQVPLQVHVPAGLAAHPHASRTLPGGLLAQSPYATQLPAGQAGLMPFPYGQQLIAAAAPRGLGFQPMAAGMPGLGAQPMMLPGGGLIRHPRRTLAPVSHPYQRVTALPGAAAAQPVQPFQMLAAGRAPMAPQQTVVQTPYGQMLVPVSSAGLQYRLAVPQPPPPQPAAVAVDPAMAALYGQYQSAYPSAYLQQFQQPTMASALAAASAQYGAAAQLGAQPQYLSAAASREQQQQQLAAAYARTGTEQQLHYDPQKLLNAHYAQLLMPEQTNNSPAANGTTTEYSDQET